MSGPADTIKRALRAIDARMPQPVRRLARHTRDVVLEPSRHRQELERLSAEVQRLSELLRQENEALLESSAYWGGALDQVRDSVQALQQGAGALRPVDEKRVPYTLNALRQLPAASTVLSFGGGTGAVERALVLVGHRVFGVAPWPLEWSEPRIQMVSVTGGWEVIAAESAAVLVTAGPEDGPGPVEHLGKLCRGGTALIVTVPHRAGALGEAGERRLRDLAVGWRLRDRQTFDAADPAYPAETACVTLLTLERP